VVDERSDPIAEDRARDACDILSAHVDGPAQELESGVQVPDGWAGAGRRRERHDGAGGQSGEHTGLDVEQVREIRLRALVRVAEDVELGHQNRRSPSLNAPLRSTSRL